MKYYRFFLILFAFAFPIATVVAGPKNSHIKCADPTPNDIFFGTATYIFDTNSPWWCNLGNGYAIEVIPWNDTSSPEYWEPVVEYRLYRIKDESGPYLLTSSKIKSAKNISALRIATDADMTLFSTVHGNDIFSEYGTSVPGLKPATNITVFTNKKAKVIKRDIRFESYPVRNHVNISEINEILDNDADDNMFSGYWNFLDRVTPKNGHVIIGGKYNLAIVPNYDQPNGYLLIFIDGDNAENSIWKSGDIKGYLSPTGFDNHYNLRWFDSHGFEAGLGECSATFDGINLLTLDFPLLESQIRFQRLL